MSESYFRSLLPDDTKEELLRLRENTPSGLRGEYKNMSDRALLGHAVAHSLIDSKHLINEAQSAYQLAKPKAKDPTPKTEDLSILGHVADMFGDVLPDFDVFHEAYNRSITGELYKLETGAQKFKTDVEDMDMVEDLFATAISFSMPLDIAVFGLGKWRGARRTQKAYQNMIKAGELKIGAKVTNLSIPKQMYASALGGAYPLAFYEGSMGYIHAKQKGLKDWDLIKETSSSVIRGGILGSVTSGMSAGFLGRKARIAQKDANEATWDYLKRLSLNDKFSWGAASKPAAIALEASTFTVGGNLLDMAAGKDVRWDEAWYDIMHNSALFGMLKLKHKQTSKLFNSVRDGRKHLVEAFRNTKAGKAWKNIKQDISDKAALEDMSEYVKNQIDKLTEEQDNSNSRPREILEDLRKMETILERAQAALRKSKSKEDFRKNHRDTFEELHKMRYTLESFVEDLKKIESDIDPENRIDKASVIKVREMFEKRQQEWEQIHSEFTEEFNAMGKEKRSKVENITELSNEFEAVGITQENQTIDRVVGGKTKKIKIYDKKGNIRNDITAAEIKAKLEGLKKAKGKTVSTMEDVEKKIRDSEEHIEGKDLASGDALTKEIVERRQDLSGQGTSGLSQSVDYVEGKETEGGKRKLKIKPKKEFEDSGSVSASQKRGLFKNSATYIRDMIQNYFPVHVPKTGSGASQAGFLDSAKAIEQIRQIRNFAEFLANRGKDFNTMEATDLRSYLSQNKAHRYAISNLFKRMNIVHNKRLEGIFESDIHEYISSPETTLAPLAKAILTKEKKKLSVGVQRQQVSIKNKTITNQTSKKGVPKNIPMSSKLTNMVAKLVNNVKKITGKEPLKGDYLLVAEDGHVLYQSDVNTIVEHFLLGKKGTRSARHLRSIFSTWGELKDSAPKSKKNKDWVKKIQYYDVISIFGLGEGEPGKGMKYLRENYGISKSQAESLMKEVKGEFIREIDAYLNNAHKPDWRKKNKDWIKMFGIKDASKYSLVESLDGLKRIMDGEGFSKIKGKSVITLSNVKWKTKTKEIKRTYSKDTVVAAMRWMIENPSRLIEVAPEDIKRGKTIIDEEGASQKLTSRERFERRLRGEAEGKIDKASSAWQATEQKLELAGKLKGLTPSQKNKLIKEEIQDITKTEETIEEWKHGDPDRGEKIAENSSIKGKESSLRSKHKYSDSKINKLRRKAFGGIIDYDVSPRFTLDQLKLYNKMLERELKLEDSPGEIKKIVDESFFPEDGANKLAKILGEKDGNYENLKGPEREIFMEIVEDFQIKAGNTFSPAMELKFSDKDVLNDIRNGLSGKSKEWGFSSWVIVQRMVKHSTGGYKKAMELYQKFIGDFGMHEEMLRAVTQAEYNEYLKEVKKKLGVTAAKNFGYWMNPNIMKSIERKLKSKKLDPELRKHYERKYEEVKDFYENSKNEFTDEYNIKRKVKASMDRIWGTWKQAVLNANKHIPKDSAKYKDLVRKIDKMKVEDYVPQVLTKEGRTHIKDTVLFKGKVKKFKDNEIERKAERFANKSVLKKYPKLKKMTLNEKIAASKKYEKAFNYQKRKLRKNEDYMADLNFRAENNVFDSYDNAKVHIENRHFMQRSGPVDAFIKVKTSTGFEIIEAYESSIFNIMAPYTISTSKYIAGLRTAPEFASSRFIFDRKGSGVKHALRMIEQDTRGKGNSQTFEYLEDLRKDLMGSRESKRNGLTFSRLGEMSSFAGLSAFAEPGIKNLILGQIQIIGTHDVARYATVMRRLFLNAPWRKDRWKNFAEAYERAEKKYGALGTTQREFGHGSEGWRAVQEGVYKWNWMHHTEAVNRIIAMETARLEYMDIIETLITPESSPRKKSMAEDWLRNLARFTESEINEVKSGKILEQNKEGAARFDFLLDKVSVYSHRATQGGTHVLDVPKFMAQDFKSWFIFQKIAASVTTNTVKNIIMPAIKYGNFAPLLKYAIAANFGGELIQGFKNLINDEPHPKENEDLIDRMFFNINRAEIANSFGLLLDAVPGLGWNQYDDVSSTSDIMRSFTPVIFRNVKELGDSLIEWGKGYKDFGQMSKDWLKESIIVYKQFDKLYTRRGRGEHSGRYKVLKGVEKAGRDYLEHLGLPKKTGEFGGSERTSYYRHIKDALYFGTDEEVAKAYYDAYNAITTELQLTPGSTWKSRDRDARKAIASSLRHMNPVYFSDDEKFRTKSRIQGFYDWAKEVGQYENVIEAEDLYNDMERRWTKISKDKSLFNRYSSHTH